MKWVGIFLNSVWNWFFDWTYCDSFDIFYKMYLLFFLILYSITYTLYFIDESIQGLPRKDLRRVVVCVYTTTSLIFANIHETYRWYYIFFKNPEFICGHSYTKHGRYFFSGEKIPQKFFWNLFFDWEIIFNELFYIFIFYFDELSTLFFIENPIIQKKTKSIIPQKNKNKF